MTKSCEQCGKAWTTRSRQARTCSPRCRAILREIEHPSPGVPRREYPDDLVVKVQEMYDRGATIREIDIAIGPGYKAQRIVERSISERRATGPRDQTGERNPQWKGNAASLDAMHVRVEMARGKPQHCALCDTTDPSLRYEWANMTGHYEEITDYARLCVPCHRKLDGRRRAQLGRPTRPPTGVMSHV